MAAVVWTSLLGCAATPGPRSHALETRPDTTAGAERAFQREDPFVLRPLRLEVGGRWIGNGVAYGPHRDGQRPGGPSPSSAQLREDLDLMTRHWRLLRVYGSAGPAESLLAVIRGGRADMKVMLGIWIQAEDRRDSTGRVVERFPDAVAANRRELEAGVRLAAEYPSIVRALCAGNETQVYWSANRVPGDRLIEIVREMRARARAPVTVADDHQFWSRPESEALARELDFITVHAHPLWNGRALDDAVAWTERTLREVQARHPGRLLVLGETGWATQRTGEGDQGKLMKGEVGETAQAEYFRALTAWVERTRTPTFFFEAFDENWKGGESPGDVEKHWGVYRADRSPKPAVAGTR